MVHNGSPTLNRKSNAFETNLVGVAQTHMPDGRATTVSKCTSILTCPFRIQKLADCLLPKVVRNSRRRQQEPQLLILQQILFYPEGTA